MGKEFITTAELIAMIQQADPTGLMPVAVRDWQEGYEVPSFRVARQVSVQPFEGWLWSNKAYEPTPTGYETFLLLADG